MENKEPNKIINNLYKRYLKLHSDCQGDANKYDYKEADKISQELKNIHGIPGACEVMSKKALWKLIRLNGAFRSIPFHYFHHPFASALGE